MNQSCVASGARRSAVLTAIVGLHFLAFLVIAAGLGPRDFAQAKEPPPVVWKQEIELVPKLVEPDRTDPVAAYADPVARPDITIPVITDAEDLRVVVAETGRTEEGSAGTALDPVVVIPPQRRTQDQRLAAMINACYPAGARRDGEEGQVVAHITIGVDGTPTAWNVSQSSGFARLDQAVGCVIRRIVFIPGRENGRAVAADASLPITFQLD